MPAPARDLLPAGLTGLALTLPLLALELVNGPIADRSIHALAPLYAALWFLPAAFILLLLSGFRATAPVAVRPVRLALRIAGMAFLACVWIALVIDQ